ncbi:MULTISPECIES: DUF2612 domain-containing protein [unclassified Acinetobacter]|uniref:DUF2612 domain-containing protein n=1 Tax=unclassified Acinetobacter TaxID=196816 RepID=UPI002448D6BA|nr:MULTISPECIES: DUF2612 domain-containing protein [unclassified Acinetobacter]MDH0030304.1 DUF2612 domain-containing protein [Acinetobacter sp. GD04021]MDH0885872.1 DUF2612 domain-containing protein [Acinetobacter sp. GD03873]MDH1082492.1 DUF2612 domain-containing protein [Acinetobacter sp. GD03983]MDH2189116.1 DUF2612 domain-containing protein [Acinetobacter sp. GD03645]MDH2202304.1 DUF2612 domain-containing protein [Acinetobacter sp. GD03647]
MSIDKYIGLLTSQHREKPKFEATIRASIEPILNNKDSIASLPSYFDLESATGDQLITIAKWVGAPTAIPDAIPMPYFGFEGQPEALPYGETDDPEIGGFWRESGVSGNAAKTIDTTLLRRVIRAQIYKNQCNCTFFDAFQILSLVLDESFTINDSGEMWISMGFDESMSIANRQLAKMMIPKPAGVEFRFDEY